MFVASQTSDPIGPLHPAAQCLAPHPPAALATSPREERGEVKKAPRFVFPIHNFKQPCFHILAAQCVRGLPVSLAKCARAMERREAPGVCATHPLEAGLTDPPRAAPLRPRAPSDVGRCASRRSTFSHQSLGRVLIRPPGAMRDI